MRSFKTLVRVVQDSYTMAHDAYTMRLRFVYVFIRNVIESGTNRKQSHNKQKTKNKTNRQTNQNKNTKTRIIKQHKTNKTGKNQNNNLLLQGPVVRRRGVLVNTQANVLPSQEKSNGKPKNRVDSWGWPVGQDGAGEKKE